MRLLAVHALLLLAVSAQAQIVPLLNPCEGLDGPACRAWLGGAAAAPLGLALVGATVADAGRGVDGSRNATATAVGLSLLATGTVLGPALGDVMAGHGREALPGVALRTAVLSGTLLAAAAVVHQVDGYGALPVLVLVATPGLVVVSWSSERDARALQRRLRADTVRRASRATPSRPVEVSLGPGAARLVVPL